jgi:F0F1-type ATP synthase delta subunit
MSRLETHKKIITLFLDEYNTADTGDHDTLFKKFAEFLSKNNIVGNEKSEHQFFQTLEEMIETQSGTPSATVTVPAHMDERNLDLLREKLQTMLGVNTVHIKEQIDENILGGIEVKIGNKLYTNTIQNNLTQLAVNLKA